MGMSILLLLLIAAFTAIVVWVFGRDRKARFAKNARIALDEKAKSRARRKRAQPMGAQNDSHSNNCNHSDGLRGDRYGDAS